MEAAISAGGRAMQMAGEIWAAYKALKILKKVSVISDEYIFQGVLLAIGDILVLLKDIVLDIADRKLGGNQKALLELTKEEKKIGGIASDIKEILYGWGREYH